MKNWLANQLARLLDTVLCIFVSFATGISARHPSELAFGPQRKVYYANHSSHGDFFLVWISLPQDWRMQAQPVAGADYWLGSHLRAFIARRVFKVLLIQRNSNPEQAIAAMGDALQQGRSLILFPEGTRNTEDDESLLPFKSGIYHLACQNPGVEFVPVWINNVNRVLPKGRILPVPLLCDVNIGQALQINEAEGKHEFVQRARQALLELAPEHAR